MVIEGVLQAAEEAGVLGVVVCAHAEEFGELGEDVAVVVLNESAVAGGARVATGSAVAVSVDPVGFSFGGRDGSGGFGEEAGGGGRTGRHWVSLPDGAVRDFCGGGGMRSTGCGLRRLRQYEKYGGLSTAAAKCAAFGGDDERYWLVEMRVL